MLLPASQWRVLISTTQRPFITYFVCLEQQVVFTLTIAGAVNDIIIYLEKIFARNKNAVT